MKKARYLVIGYGWRTDFFYRIAQLCPERFEVCAGVLRTRERAAQVSEEKHIYATEDLEKALETKPDFAVLCVPKAIGGEYLLRLMERGVPVLKETPPASSLEEMTALWEAKEKYGGRVQVAEQYFLQPYYAAVLQIIGQGYLGEVSNISLSAVHDYHAVSVFRKVLGVGFENCVLEGREFRFPVTQTNGRQGFVYDGTVKLAERKWGYMQFDSGKTAFLDFSGEQYHSLIRARRWNVQGKRGEINDMVVRFLTKENLPVEQKLRRLDMGINNNKEWALKRILFLDKSVYENPFYPARLNDDEIAVAACLWKMKEYVDTGVEFYPLEEALQDAYLGLMMDQAIASGEKVRTRTQKWASDSIR